MGKWGKEGGREVGMEGGRGVEAGDAGMMSRVRLVKDRVTTHL